MAKKANLKPLRDILRNIPTENVNLLYFLFLLTIVHLGYFIMKRETVLLVSFCIAMISVYLVNTNMVIVLAASLLFVDILYSVRKVPEGFDSSGNEMDDTGTDVSGNTDSMYPFKKKKQGFENKDAVNPIVSVPLKEKIKEEMIGKDLEEAEKETQSVQSLVTKIKNTNPEIAESLKLLNSIDINELNKLINNVNGIVGTFKTSD